jgi:hypothetical protein
MILPSPVYLYAGAAALAIGAFGGYKVRDWQCDAALANALERAQEQREEMQNEVDERARAYEALRTETDALGSRSTREIHTIYQEVPAAPAECEPDYRVVGLLQGSVRAANANASGQSGGPLPQPTDATGTTTRPREGDLGN